MLLSVIDWSPYWLEPPTGWLCAWGAAGAAWLFCLRDLGIDLCAFDDVVGDVRGDEITDLETAHDLEDGSEVAADVNRLNVNDAVVDESDDIEAVADGDGVSGDGDGTFAGGDGCEGDDGVHAVEQLPLAVVDLHLGEEGAGVLVDGRGGAGDDAGKWVAGNS